MLVGHFGAGKTSVKRSLLGDEFKEEYETTDGVDTDDMVEVASAAVEKGENPQWRKSEYTVCHVLSR